MGRPPVTIEQLQRRKRAYDMWASGILEKGTPASIRSIAMELGVTVGSVNYWRQADAWDTKMGKDAARRQIRVARDSNNLVDMLRTSMYKHMRKLNGIINDPQMSIDVQLKAIAAYMSICSKLKLIQPDMLAAFGKENAATITGFKDDLDEHVQRSAAGASPAPDAAAPASDDGTDDHVDNDAQSAELAGTPGSLSGTSVSEPDWNGESVERG